MVYELAEVNFSRLLAPLDDPLLADFVAALDPVNAAAENAPGFIWRLQTEDGNAMAVRAFDWDAGESAGVIINMSVWSDIDRLTTFVYGEMHRQILRRRRNWFETMTQPTTALWWVTAGHRPTTEEAEGRIRQLRAHGPTPESFTLRTRFAPPGSDRSEAPTPGRPDWLCPA